MTMLARQEEERPTVLILDADAIVRHVLAEYLRACGYLVVEAASVEEVFAVLNHGDPPVDTILFDLDLPGETSGFALARTLRATYPDIDVIPAGSPASATKEAADLCDEGPKLGRPYDPQLALAEIKRLSAARAANK